MAETVAIMAMRPLVSMLISKASSYLLDKYKVMEGMEKQLKILKRRLSAILDVIIDAEKQATEHREGAKVWLQDLKTVAYEANEVFDEFKYEALRREAKKNGHYRKRDAIKLFPTHNRVVFRHRMGIKLGRILEDIEALLTDMQVFGFKYQPHPSLSNEGRQTNHVIFDPQEIASRSRDKEKRNIVDTLLRQANNADLAVVPIVGMGGLGKTTLAQLIYNEPNVQKHFQLPLWVCVSDTFDVNSLAKSIVEASTKKDEDTDKPPLDRLQKLVRGQRFLLVLDDVWNREVHKWERLKVCLQHGGSGSVVLITTRDKRVAEIMGTDEASHLNKLEDNFLKEIIEAKAFGSDEEKPTELVEMVGEIVKRCCGSPLAATALGSVLRTKASTKEWEAVLSGSSICTKETGILPILKLSYNELPSHMKQSFAFCAIFPKDYKINVDKLIQLWIANGFIPEHKEDSFETVGKQIFDELASRSFFVEIEKSKDRWDGNYSITTCKIHDLMHDIAMSVMEKECLVVTVKPSQTEWFPDTARHLFLSCGETEGILNDCMKKTYPAIQTLICDSGIKSHLKHPSKYSSLHALKLHEWTGSFVLKPKYLPQLRYLDLSNSCIKELPEDISILYNLQMLDLSNCRYLNRLPRQMKYMTSLYHIYTHGCRKLERMPPELGRLTKLQTLTCFVAADVAGPDCSDVAELENLNLGGQLEIRLVEKVREAEKKLANLGNKKGLIELTLRWTSVCDTEVLSSFEPHDRLQVLKIHSYGGKCLGILQSMVEIHLSRCERLQVLFKCSTFPNLKELTLEHLLDFERWLERNEEQITFPRLEELSIENCQKLIALPGAPLLQETCIGGGYRLARSAFPVLKVLKLEYLESFERWDAAVEGVEILFPRLEELSIKNCPKLIALPEAPLLQETCTGGGYRLARSAFPALKVLKLKNLESFERWDAAVEGVDILFPRLEELSIENCPKLIALPGAPSLQETCIGGGYRSVSSAFPALKVLKLKILESFQRWDAAVEGVEILFPWLEELSIENCQKLIALPGAPLLQETCTGGGYRLARSAFPALKVLKMIGLESFQRWDASVERVEILFPRLEELSIKNCPKLIALPGAPLLQETCTGGGYRLARSAFPALKVLKMIGLESFQRWDASVERVEILFPRLEELSIERCRKLIALPEAPCSGNYRSAFPSLKVVQIENLKNFHKWDAKAGSEQMLFPQLENLSIKVCPELMDLPEAPKLSVLVIVDGKQEIFHWVDRYWSSLTELTLKLENTKTTSGAECTSMLPVDSKEKWDQKSPHTFMQLGCCNSFFGSGGLEPWGYFVHLGGLAIDRCDVLVHWPVVVFQSLVSLKRLRIKNCNNLTGYAQAPVQPSASERSQHLPALESLRLAQCASLVEMFNVPASLKSMHILLCSKLESIFGKQQLGTSELVQGSSCSETIVPTAVSQLSPSPVIHFCPCLEYLELIECGSLSGVLHLPPSLKTTFIDSCSSIQVLSCQLDGLPKPESCASDPSAATAAAGEHSLPSCLTYLYLESCAGMLGGILRLPTSLKTLSIKDNSGLTSLESVSGHPLSLECLCLIRCSALASLPNEPQAYGSFSQLEIKDCPAIKKLPRCLQQRLGSIRLRALDAQYEVMAFKPKTWKQIPRLVRERKVAKRRAEWRRQDNDTTEEQEAE